MITPEIAHINNIISLVPPDIVFTYTHRQDPDCDVKLEAFREGRQAILLCTQALIGEGVDIPTLSGIVYLGGGRSETANTQWVGRGMRKPEGKIDCKIYDFADGTDLLAEHALERARLWIELGYKVDLSNVSWMRRILRERKNG